MLEKADSGSPSELVALNGKEPTDHTCPREPREALSLYIEASECTQCYVFYLGHETVRPLYTQELRNGGKHSSEGSEDTGNHLPDVNNVFSCCSYSYVIMTLLNVFY